MRIFILTLVLLFHLTGCEQNDPNSAKSEQNAGGVISNEGSPANLILKNGFIYTVDANRTIASAVAIADNQIIYVGDDQGVLAYKDENTEVIDLDGKMMLPGLHDVHIHPFGIIEIDQCDLKSEAVDLKDMVPLLQQCIVRYQLQPGEWLAVDQWSFSYGNSPSSELPNIRAALDAVSAEHPIMLLGNDGHHGAVNTAALNRARNLAGKTVPITSETLATEYAGCKEFIGVDSSGNPNGAINEKARQLFDLSLFDIWGGSALTESDMGRIAERLAVSGITSVMDAATFPEQLPLYASYANTDKASFRLTTALFADPNSCLSDQVDAAAIDSIINKFSLVRENYRNHPYIKADTAKMFIDGVAEGNPLATPPTLPNAAALIEYKQPVFAIDMENETAEITGYVDTDSKACLAVQNSPESYQSAESVKQFIQDNGHVPGQCLKSKGVYENSLEYMETYAQSLYDNGFYIHAHAIGDRAVRTALDIFENLDDLDSINKSRMSLAHAQYIHPDDVVRVGELGVSIAFTYVWSAPGFFYDMSTIPFLDEVNGVEDLYNEKHYSIRQYYPARQVEVAGGYLTAGSDAPVDSRDPRPFVNMEVAVSRANEEGQAMNVDAGVSIDSIISAYTINGARQLHQDDRLGSIEAGKIADMIVLNQNLIELFNAGQVEKISETKVTFTVFDGKIVYRE